MDDVINMHNRREIVGVYRDTDPIFFWANIVDGALKSAQEFHTCRESLASQARNYFNGKEKKDTINPNNISLGILKFGFNNIDRLKSAHNVLNVIEEHYGWVKTKMWILDKKSCQKPASCSSEREYEVVYFKGSKKWLKSSHMISLFALILRLSLRKTFKNVKKFDDFLRKVKSSKSNDNDMRWMKRAIQNMDVILGDYNNLFRGMTTKRMYDDNILANYHASYAEGINRLCAGETGDKKLYNRLIKIAEKHNMKRRTAAAKSNAA